jgi:hypothetical protein
MVARALMETALGSGTNWRPLPRFKLVPEAEHSADHVQVDTLFTSGIEVTEIVAIPFQFKYG